MYLFIITFSKLGYLSFRLSKNVRITVVWFSLVSKKCKGRVSIKFLREPSLKNVLSGGIVYIYCGYLVLDTWIDHWPLSLPQIMRCAAAVHHKCNGFIRVG